MVRLLSVSFSENGINAIFLIFCFISFIYVFYGGHVDQKFY